MQDWAASFYKSQAWKHLRANIIRRDHYLCQDCLKSNRFTPADEVHHIIELTPENISDESISLNPGNLVSLCRSCHQRRHTSHPRRYIVDELGRVDIRIS